VKALLILRVAFLLAILAISVPRGFAQGGTPVFQRRYVPPPSETPVRGYEPESEPIPNGWIYAGEAVVVLLCAVVLIAAARAWRASNIFERQYRLPSGEPAARRFGGTRSGGFMAVIEPAKEREDA
jgi:hypothetical protein